MFQTLLLVLVFVAVTALVLGLAHWVSPDATRDRLRRLGPAGIGEDRAASRGFETLAEIVAPLGRLAAPEEGFEQSALRRKFTCAGLRHPKAPTVFFGLKTVLTFALPLLAFGLMSLPGTRPSGDRLQMILAVLAAVGYYLPNLVLDRLAKERQRELFEAFPDALDLLTICVEAGLGTEAAMMRVAEDIGLKSRALADELKLLNLELRAGSNRERALRNLALRTGVEEIDGFVTMIIQAERFGTGVASALRIQSDMLRTKRRQRAEEAAARISLKLMFPLMLCIFPALLVVMIAPAMMGLGKVFGSLGG